MQAGYRCNDIGTDKCPCILMEAGQCYMCGMIQRGKCDCESKWQEICPYSEYLHNGKIIEYKNAGRKFLLCDSHSYSPTLTVLTIKTPVAFGIKCKELGSFLMVLWKGWKIPISVLKVSLDYKCGYAKVEIAVNAAGPKTIGLLKDSLVGGEITLFGPYYSGVINKRNFNKDSLCIAVAKGVAIMPLINMKEYLGGSLISLKIDTKKLPKEFLEKYMGDIEWESVDLEECVDANKEGFLLSFAEDYEYCLNCTGKKPNVMFMTSPYFVEKLLNMTKLPKQEVICPNHVNMCCAEGGCGSCSYADEEGQTVRMCKCID